MVRPECSAAVRTSKARLPHPVDEAQCYESYSEDHAGKYYSISVDNEDEVVDVDHS